MAGGGTMNIDFGLMVLESVLLAVTIILLLYNIREGRQRDMLLAEVGRATKILTRQEYFFALLDTMRDAEREIVGCITGSPPAGEDIRMSRSIVETIEKLTAKGVRVAFVLPKFPDRLQVGMLYSKAGAEVRFSSDVMVHAVRYSVVDEKVVVLGVPESAGDKEATRKGYRIPSEGLARILKGHFDACEKISTLREYVREVIKQTGAPPDHVAREFHLDEKALRELLK
jgi:hypothetical protein